MKSHIFITAILISSVLSACANRPSALNPSEQQSILCFQDPGASFQLSQSCGAPGVLPVSAPLPSSLPTWQSPDFSQECWGIANKAGSTTIAAAPMFFQKIAANKYQIGASKENSAKSPEVHTFTANKLIMTRSSASSSSEGCELDVTYGKNVITAKNASCTGTSMTPGLEIYIMKCDYIDTWNKENPS
ncbi:MAG: hypothetical protein IV090_15335 [Candidatus Sericytochromatia bacterium]|nr:hypothetical protein [Candidatus Sericytochromatia bacterium]